MSRVLNVGVSTTLIPHHDALDGQEFPHLGCKGDLLGLSSLEEAMIEGLDHRVVLRCHQSSHVEGGPHRRTSTPYPILTSQCAAVPVEGSDPTRALIW